MSIKDMPEFIAMKDERDQLLSENESLRERLATCENNRQCDIDYYKPIEQERDQLEVANCDLKKRVRELKEENHTLRFALGSVREYIQSIGVCIDDALKEGE